MGEDSDRAAVDGAVPGHDPVAEQRVRVARRAGQCTDFQETARIKQFSDALPSTGKAALVPLGGCGLTGGFGCQIELFTQFGQ